MTPTLGLIFIYIWFLGCAVAVAVITMTERYERVMMFLACTVVYVILNFGVVGTLTPCYKQNDTIECKAIKTGNSVIFSTKGKDYTYTDIPTYALSNDGAVYVFNRSRTYNFYKWELADTLTLTNK